MKIKNSDLLRKKVKYETENKKKFAQGKLIFFFSFVFSILLSSGNITNAQTSQTMTIPAGSYIINMGVSPQTVANALKPYGLLYALLNNNVLVHWVINPTKSKDGIDFSYNGVDYKGGPFVIEAKFLTNSIKSLISTWNALGVVGVYTTSPISVPVLMTFTSLPNWTLDKRNGSVMVTAFNYAGIPASAYGGSSSTNWKDPSQLTCCDDIFVMPHADPIWSTHGHLMEYTSGTGNGTTSGCKSAVWLGCHAGSALMDMFNPAMPSEQTNFLAAKTGNASGTGPYYQNALLLWGNHSSGTLPYSYDYPADPVMQFLGTIDAAVQNGSEQIYIPLSPGWFTNTHVGVYDPDHSQIISTQAKHRAAILAYGPAYGDEENGHIMLEASHNVTGTATANVAAQRAFFNFSFFTAWDKAQFGLIPSINGFPEQLYADQTSLPISYSLNDGGDGTVQDIQWASSCGGTFGNSKTQSTTYTPPVINTTTTCILSVTITDQCGRKSFDTHPTTFSCRMTATPSITNLCYGQTNTGAINMTMNYGTAPYIWNWTKTGGGTGNGTGTSITGLSAGTYTVTVTERNGAGCSYTFTAVLTQSPEIIITSNVVPVSCKSGSNGSIDITVSGGTPGYTYLWTDGPTTPNRSGLPAGSYTLTVTDSKGCTKSSTITITEPSEISITPTVGAVSCYGGTNGTISLAVTGGNSPYTYLWNDGNTNQNRTGLSAGTYSVTVTDSKSCTKSLNDIVVSQPVAALTLSQTHVNILCNGASTGSIDLTISGGTSTYTKNWTGPNSFTATTEDISGLIAGTYTVVVTDSKSCSSTLSVTITQPTSISLSTSVTSPTCPPDAQNNSSDGAINLTVSGGTPITPGNTYTYLWSATNGGIVPTGQENNQDLTGLVAGTYSVTVTDANSCTKTTSVTLNYLHPNPSKPTSIVK